MNKNYETKVSKFISLILRHKPETINIELDANGWADVGELLAGINKKGHKITINDLKLIVDNDEKGRYAFSDNYSRIRANQGHSINIDAELKEKKPPIYLFHGTGEKSLEAIMREGLKHMSRLYVHLSDNYDTAVSVGKRHGTPVVLKVKSEEMYAGGYKFYLSENNVWLTKEVPAAYIELI